MFEVGQQVECVDASFSARERYWIKQLPVAGQRYTISELEAGARGLGLRLAEICNPSIPVVRKVSGEEFQFVPTFLVSRFRPITDISVFREMLELVDS